MIEITILGTPTAKQRHRVGRRGMYDPQATEKDATRRELVLRRGNKQSISSACSVEIVAVYKRPKSHYGTGKNSVNIKESALIHKTSKPDIDNIEKYYLDCANGILFYDDSLVCMSRCIKRWGNTARVTIRVNKL